MNKNSNLTSRVVKGSSIIILFTVLLSPLGYFIRILYSQSLSIELFGLFYAVLNFFTLITTYNDLGFGYSLTFFLPKYIKKNDFQTSWQMYKIVQIIEVSTSIILSILLIAFASFIADNFFKVPVAKNLIYIFCIYLIAHGFLSALINLFNGLQKELYYSSIHLMRMLFTLSFSIFFWLIDSPNVIYYAISWAGAYICVGIIYNFILHKKYPYLTKNKFHWDKQLYLKMQSYALPALLTTSIFSLTTFSDSFFLTIFRGVKEVGIYNIILPLVTISSIFLAPLSNLLVPLISHLVEGEKGKVIQLLNAILKIIPFVGIYFSLFLILFPSISVSLLFGKKWVGLVEIPLIILALGYIIMPLSSYLTIVISGLGKIHEKLKASILISLASILLNGVLVFYYGILGAVIANSLVFILSVIIFGNIVKKEINFQYPTTYYLKLLLMFLVVYFLVKFLGINPVTFWQFILCGIVYTIVIFIFSFFLKVFDLNMLKWVFKLTNEKQSHIKK